jgi:hypothetical protein
MKEQFYSLASPILVLFATFSGGMIAAVPTAETGHAEKQAPGITVTLSVPRKAFKRSEPIPVRMEIYNACSETVLINRLATLPAHLTLFVFDERGRRSPAVRNVSSTPSPRAEGQPESWAFLKWWVALDPRHFYGSTFEIDSQEFPFLAKVGRYRLVGSFMSTGGYPPELVQNIVSVSPEVPSKVPYPIWTGRVDTNSVWFEVVPR